MNLVFHQLKKDILRTRLLLGFWLVLVILQFALTGWTIKPGDALMQSFYQMMNVLLTLFNYLLVMVLVPVLVHQEPLVGTTAFWFTRPLARSTLLASKTWYVLMLVALPMLVQSIVFLANGVTLPDVIRALPEILIDELSWILVVAMLAVLTPNFARFAIVGAIILVIWYLVLVVLQMLLLMRNPLIYASTPYSLTASRGLVGSLSMLGFGGAVVLLQYLTRRFTLAVALVAASLVASLLVQYFWPWDFLKPPLQLVQDSAFQADAVSAKLTTPIQASDQVTNRGGAPMKLIRGTVIFSDYPKGYLVNVETIDSSLTSADGQKIPLQPPSQRISYGNPDPDAVEKALDGVPVLNMNNAYDPEQDLFNLDGETYGRYGATPLNYSAQLKCTAYKYVVVTELPLTKGAHFDRGSEHLAVTDVLNQPDGVDVLLRQRNVRLLFAPHGQDVNPYVQGQNSVIYLLLNKARHEAIRQKQNYSFNMVGNQGILVNEPVRLSFGPDDNNPNNWLGPPLDQAWLADAVLVRLELAPVATFTRTLDVPGFRLDGKFEIPGGRSITDSQNQARVADLDALDQITLPHDATREQVQTYITDILTVSRRLNNYNEHDPQIEMLEKVGAENVDLLIQMARDNHDYYLNRAINTLAQPDHKEMVIAALATNHDLIDTVVDHGWQSDAKPVLLTMFDNKNIGYPGKWVVAIASLQDPSTYDALKNYYIENPGSDLFKALQSLPNFDLAGTFDLAWKKARAGRLWQIRDMLEPAAQFGEPDVIEAAVNILKRSDDYSKQRARKVLKDYTPATGATDADLIHWFDSNRANLVFDPVAKKFVLGPVPSSAPSTPPAPPPPVPPAPPVKTDDPNSLQK